MRSYLQEDQYRVVGTMDAGATHVSWYDTAEQAIEVALRFDRGIVLRPDGSLLGEYFARRHAPPDCAHEWRAGEPGVTAHRARCVHCETTLGWTRM